MVKFANQGAGISPPRMRLDDISTTLKLDMLKSGFKTVDETTLFAVTFTRKGTRE